MADQKITALTELTTPATGDVFPVVDMSAGSTKKITLGNIQSNLTITESQISDLDHYTDSDVASYLTTNNYLSNGDNISLLTNDSGFITDYTVTELDVTTHEAALSITESQISDFGSYASASHTHTLSDITDSGTAASKDTGTISGTIPLLTTGGVVASARISETSVTQHEAALTITESQISDLDHDDFDAIHNNVSGEINAITEKVSPVAADLIIIEDSEAANGKKKVQVGNLPGGDSHTHTLFDITDSGDLAALDTVDTAEITNEAVTEDKLDATNAPDNGEVLSYNTAFSKFEWVPQSSGDGGGTSNNIVSPPQLFNPDATGVTNDTDTFTVANDNPIAFVTVNGQVIDDNEYSLSGTTLTVSPDNGYESISDEVLVFQNNPSELTNTTEEVQDDAWAVLTGTQTLITVTYDDINNEVDFVVENDLSQYDNTTSGFITGYTVTEADVTQHQAALSITESQISDLSHVTNNNQLINGAGYITDYTVTEADVTTHQAALSILESQISDLGAYLESVDIADINATGITDGTTYLRGDGTWATPSGGGGGASELSDLSDVNTSTPTNRNVLLADGIDWESRALVEADISDLGNYITDYTVTEADVTQHQAAIDHDQLTNYSVAEHFLQAQITTVGTIALGTWQGDDIAVAHGGTGASTATDARTNLGLGTAATKDTGIISGTIPLLTTGGVIVANSISQTSVVQHEAALTITESQISDLSHVTNNNQLTNGAGYITGYTVTELDVTQHESALTITESQISDLGNYAVSVHTHTLSDITDSGTAASSDTGITSGTIPVLTTGGVIASGRISQTSIVQHEAALTITESQISDLSHVTNNNELTNGAGYITGYTVTEVDVTAHEAALTITESQISDLSHYTDSDTASYLSANGYVNTPQTKAITIESPTDSEDITLFFTDDAITVSQINAVLNGSSIPSVTYTIRHGSDRSAAGNEVVTSGSTTTSTTTGDEVTSFNDATIPAGSWVWIETTAQSGTVDQMNVTLEYA